MKPPGFTESSSLHRTGGNYRARENGANRSCRQTFPATCPMRILPAQRIRRCGLNATSHTRLQRCDGDWWPVSLDAIALPLPRGSEQTSKL
jgi:hypothetical protein